MLVLVGLGLADRGLVLELHLLEPPFVPRSLLSDRDPSRGLDAAHYSFQRLLLIFVFNNLFYPTRDFQLFFALAALSQRHAVKVELVLFLPHGLRFLLDPNTESEAASELRLGFDVEPLGGEELLGEPDGVLWM